MPTAHISYSDVTAIDITTEDTDGSSVDGMVTLIPVLITDADKAEWLALYDPTSSTSPPATDSRRIARAVLDALRKYEGL
jgi:hypothetical protein